MNQLFFLIFVQPGGCGNYGCSCIRGGSELIRVYQSLYTFWREYNFHIWVWSTSSMQEVLHNPLTSSLLVFVTFGWFVTVAYLLIPLFDCKFITLFFCLKVASCGCTILYRLHDSARIYGWCPWHALEGVSFMILLHKLLLRRITYLGLWFTFMWFWRQETAILIYCSTSFVAGLYRAYNYHYTKTFGAIFWT